jgi:hypothetical protein
VENTTKNIGKTNELLYLAREESTNSRNDTWEMMKLFLYSEIVELTYKKEATLAGLSGRDERVLIARRKELWEIKNKGRIASTRPSTFVYFNAYLRLVWTHEEIRNNTAIPLRNKRKDRNSSEVEYDDTGETNIPSLEYLRTHAESG